MSFESPDQPRRPLWAPVGDGDAKAAPASAAMTPEPIDAEDSDADIIRPVASPPSEETFPTFGGFPPASVTPYGSEDPDPEPEPVTDPVRALGQSAVTNASFSAGGAHTPMGGVPLPRATFLPDDTDTSDLPVTPATPDGLARVSAFASEAPASAEPGFVPTFAAREPTPSAGQPTVSFASIAPTSRDLPVEPSPPHHASGGHGGGEYDSDPWWRSVVALVVYGVLVMASLAYGVYAMVLAPEPVTLAQEVLLEGPPDNGIDPVELVEPTPFLAGAPLKTPTHSLTAVQSYALGELDNLPGRTAEVHDLTYFDGDTTYVVRAYQHYNADDAAETLMNLTTDAPGLVPVEVGGEPVGERAEVLTEDGPSIVWSNTTAVFVLTGPEEGIEEFYTLFGW